MNESDMYLFSQAILGLEALPALKLTTLRESSPANGESEVSVNRETIVRFRSPLAEGTTLTRSHLTAVFGRHPLLSRIELSPQRDTATLFYLETLPGSARIVVTMDGTGIRDFRGWGQRVDQ